LCFNLENRLLKPGVLFDVQASLGIFMLFLGILEDSLFLELTDMTSHAFEVSLELGDLRVGFKKIL